MSLPRGSHSNCGSQPSGWEPFFLYSQAASFSFFLHAENHAEKSALVLRFSDSLSSPSQLVLCKSACAAPEALIGGQRSLLSVGPRGASQHEGNEKIRCGLYLQPRRRSASL